MAGERQTEPHQALHSCVRDHPYIPHAQWLENELARVRAKRDELREQIDWTVQRCNAAMGDGFKGTPNSAVAAVCDALQTAKARAESQAAEIVALIRSYANVHMTKALADLIEHKYGADDAPET